MATLTFLVALTSLILNVYQLYIQRMQMKNTIKDIIEDVKKKV
jgi:hypothetical protein